MNKPKRANPLWETVALGSSFFLLWMWFLSDQVAKQTPEGKASPIWQYVLGAALIALVVITVRRMNRVRRVFSGEDEAANEEASMAGLPPFGPLPPGAKKSR